jgi:hypothetical protein
MWSLLLVTLPTQPNAVRVRIWRALKALGCAALRDGAYILPAALREQFEPLAAEVREHGGSAQVMALEPSSEAQRQELTALFDRSAAYAEWRDSATTLQAELAEPAAPAGPANGAIALTETEARRRLRTVADALAALQRTDHYPGPSALQAQQNLTALRQAMDAAFSRGEPSALPAHDLPLLDRRKFQGKRWATRARPWVDRLACAWLICRFIDANAELVWLPEGASAPRGALGYDFDGARFTHVGARVSFEVLLAQFGLESDPALKRLAATVHVLDAGGIPTPEAAGLEAVLAGLRELHAQDDALAAAAAQVFDALYATPRGTKPAPQA